METQKIVIPHKNLLIIVGIMVAIVVSITTLVNDTKLHDAPFSSLSKSDVEHIYSNLTDAF